MKKFCLTNLTILLFLISANSQEYFSKGSNIITGDINIGFSDSENINDDINYSYENKAFGFSTDYGKFIKNNLVIGIGLGYSNFYREHNREDADSIYFHSVDDGNQFSTNFFARKYFPINEKFGSYFHSSLSYYYSKSKYTLDERESDNTSETIGISAGLGLYYFVLNKLSLSLNLGYIRISSGKTSTQNRNSTNISDSNSSNVHVSFINQISFDQLLTINYHF